MLEDFVGDLDIILIIFAGHPETQHLGPVLVDHLLRRHDIPHGFGHLLALAIDYVTMGEHALIGSPPPGAHRGEQGGLKPAAVLVAALQIEIRR